ncbi:MAG: peptidoglycan DD-metalloendopeptidase family protein [Bacilli bacterium]|jgi:murein DD-endopeptidase MepM/ murein hydrolase activator NlpD|nr:peptidoglycan DD-metalloendopeptidase family protein [Bacilli bacterium]
MRRIKYLSLSLIVLFVLTISVNAEINYKKEYKYYDKICSIKSGYLLNEQACNDFEEYKKGLKDGTTQQKESVKDSSLDAQQLTVLINKNRELIEKKEAQYTKITKQLKSNKNKLVSLEKEVVNRLGTMQYYGDENQVIDIIMSSTNLDDLMTKIDGISAMNKDNIETIYELEKTTRDLENNQIQIKGELTTLKQTKAKQEKLIADFYRKEQALYTGTNSGGTGEINAALDSIDFDKITASKTLNIPLKHAIVTASTWYYPGGGWHPGIDLATKVGTNVIAPANGVVLSKSSGANGYGNHIIVAVKVGNYVYTLLFAHLSAFTNVSEFSQGDVIAYTGNTGNSTGPHLHVEVFRHNTDDIKVVVDEFKKNKDYWFGLGYSNKGDCNKVCRLQPAEVFNLKMGESF